MNKKQLPYYANENVYIKDIVARNNLNTDQEISELVDILASGISSLTNPRKLENTFKSVKNSTLCASTIDKYIGYLKDSFLLSKAERYDVRGKNTSAHLISCILRTPDFVTQGLISGK